MLIPVLATLFMFSITVSQSAMDLFATLLALAIGFHLFKKKITFSKIGLEWLWLIWISVIVLGFLTGPPSEGRWVGRILEFRWFLYVYVMIMAFSTLDLNKKLIRNICIGLLIAPILYGFASYAANYDWLLKRPMEGRMVGFYGSPMTFGHGFSIPFLILLGTIFVFIFGRIKKQIQFPKDINDWLMICTTLLLGLALFLTFTRGVWIAVFAAIAFGCFWLSRLWGALFVVGASGAVTAMFFYWEKFHDRVMRFFDANSYDHERMTLWKANWRIFLDHPIFGVGHGQNRHLLRQYYDQMGVPQGYFESHAHNQYIHYLAGTGILGCLCYLFLWGFMIRLSLKGLNNLKLQNKTFSLEYGLLLGCLMAQISFLIGGLTEANFEHAKVVYMVLTMWGLNYCLYKQSAIRA